MTKIFVVDDEPKIIQFLKDGLEKRNFVVCSATSGEQALQEIKKAKPDLILLDAIMNGMSGFEVLKQLKEDRKTVSIPVIMLTAKGAPEDVEEGIGNYADKYFTKPFDFKLLIEEIGKTLALCQG